ncbi:tripartite tricarboxylate transporter substrate binding protein [Variovorax saccharolyticus]|uniref:tripartite tricarboxylate transporter substrate binding protein n=1 Tax=Variovorax saccharolyticus TaxID=3053516 RepID=UPI00257752DC|nr:tripartite tricarboxylate transporter substrate binding protein [Variovorax sp. J31P216]MDM0025492.1 tripartite tricarboxylate transporter substrate binding protein [Variovorax sp. J31P216]
MTLPVFRHVLTAGALLLAAASALAQATAPAAAWPTKPVRIIHGFTSGGPVDNLARLLAAQFPEAFGQQAIVEGKPGAGGTIGANYVAKAEPDGYTLFLMASGHSAAPGLYKSLPFDAVSDFTMVSMVARSPFAIIAGPGSTAGSLQELVAAAKAQPGKIDYGSGGTGSGMHLAAVLFQARAGVQFTHVPYKGGSAPALAVMSGEVPIIFTSLAGMASHIESGKVRPLAVTSRSRFAAFPEIPTVAETVLPDFDVSAWYALAGPKNLPPAIVARLNQMVQATLRRPEIVQGLKLQAAEPWPTSAREAQAFLATDVARWTQVVKDENIAPPPN